MTDVTSERNRDSRVRCFACPDALTGLRVFRARAENKTRLAMGVRVTVPYGRGPRLLPNQDARRIRCLLRPSVKSNSAWCGYSARGCGG